MVDNIELKGAREEGEITDPELLAIEVQLTIILQKTEPDLEFRAKLRRELLEKSSKELVEKGNRLPGQVPDL